MLAQLEDHKYGDKESYMTGSNDAFGEHIVRGSLCNGRDDVARNHIVRGSL